MISLAPLWIQSVLDRLVHSHWFSLAELLLVFAAGIGWIVRPEVGIWLLLVVVFPRLLRVIAGKTPFPRTRFDWLIALFVLTAISGYWAAYDKPIAWSKFWFIIASVFLYYALAAQPKKNLVYVSNVFFFLGVGISIYFLLTHDFTANSAGVGFFSNLTVWWMQSVHQTGWAPLVPSYVSGVLTLTAPFFLFRLHTRAPHRSFVLADLLFYLSAGVLILVFIMTITRGVVVAIVSAMGVWIIWKVLGSNEATEGRKRLFSFLVLAYLGFVLLLVHIGLSSTGTKLPSQIRFGADTRTELFDRSLSFLADFPLTGGGLNSFPGLYSNYILNIPFFYFINSYNTFLDVAIEQGLMGGLIIFYLYLAAVWISSRIITTATSLEVRTFGWLILYALVVATVHGTMYDYLYNGAGAFLLLFPVGAAVGGMHIAAREEPNESFLPATTHGGSLIRFVLVIVFLAISWVFNADKIRSIWYANLGAVQLAQVELDGFPNNGWHTLAIVPRLEEPTITLQTSLQLDPQNLTANHRLGLIYMLQRDFSLAAHYLEKAYHLSPNHRGITKALGYCYVWLGEYDRAWFFLAQIPESSDELDVYTWWWGTQGREDLAEKAALMIARLNQH